MTLTYSEYNNLIEILEKSDENMYEDLMKKEKNVLSTINHVVNNIKEKDDFLDLSISHIFEKFFLIWPKMFNDLMDSKNLNDAVLSIIKEDRIIYIGILLIIIAILSSLSKIRQ